MIRFTVYAAAVLLSAIAYAQQELPDADKFLAQRVASDTVLIKRLYEENTALRAKIAAAETCLKDK